MSVKGNQTFVIITAKAGDTSQDGIKFSFAHGKPEELQDAVVSVEKATGDKVVGVLPKEFIDVLAVSIREYEDSIGVEKTL